MFKHVEQRRVRLLFAAHALCAQPLTQAVCPPFPRTLQVLLQLILYSELISLSNTDVSLTFATNSSRSFSFETRVRVAADEEGAGDGARTRRALATGHGRGGRGRGHGSGVGNLARNDLCRPCPLRSTALPPALYCPAPCALLPCPLRPNALLTALTRAHTGKRCADRTGGLSVGPQRARQVLRLCSRTCPGAAAAEDRREPHLSSP